MVGDIDVVEYDLGCENAAVTPSSYSFKILWPDSKESSIIDSPVETIVQILDKR